MQYLVGLDEKSKTVPLGRWGEKSVTEIAIDVSSWIAEYGTGTVTIWFKRSQDTDFYPVTTNLSNGIATHTLSDADMQYLGKGELGVIYTNSEGQIKKSRKYATIVLDAVEGESTEPPEPYASWVAEVLNAAQEAKDAVTHYPKIVNDYWYVWDADQNKFVDTGVYAKGIKGDKGETGATGNGIASTVLNDNYTLTITFTDGTTYTTPSIRGEQGKQGIQGIQGETGATGNGIASTVLNADYTLTITFTDGTSYTTDPIRGEKGEKGDNTTAEQVTYDSTLESHVEGSVGEALSTQSEQIDSLEALGLTVVNGKVCQTYIKE